MPEAMFVFEINRPFDYGAFTKHLVHSGNVLWRKKPGVFCNRSRFRKAVEVEARVDKKTAEKMVSTMIELGMISVDSDNDVIVNELLRK